MSRSSSQAALYAHQLGRIGVVLFWLAVATAVAYAVPYLLRKQLAHLFLGGAAFGATVVVRSRPW